MNNFNILGIFFFYEFLNCCSHLFYTLRSGNITEDKRHTYLYKYIYKCMYINLLFIIININYKVMQLNLNFWQLSLADIEKNVILSNLNYR